MKCINCDSCEFFNDYARCETICEKCGYVTKNDTLTSSLVFSSENGISSLTGKIIEISQSFTKVNNTFIHSSSFNIENKIQSICTLLGLSSDFGTSAFRWYKLSLQHNLSKAKNIIYTLAASVYLVCRQKKTPHFLIDFANALNISSFQIGRVFFKMVKLLNLAVEHNDPSIFLPRYFTKLKFNNQDILTLALRMIMRMKSDWIMTGRRPNNLCGAALLIAGRIYNEERSGYEVACAVNGSIPTINKRLKEIMMTDTANLTVNEFMSVWLEKEEDPPVFKKERKKEVAFLDPNVIFSFDSDDDEIKDCILTNEESQMRETVWNEMYAEFMEWKKKKSEIKKPRKKRKKVFHADEAIKHCLEEKKLTNKIDFNALKKLFE